MKVDVTQQPPYIQGHHQKAEVEAKGIHRQTETILPELCSTPRCNEETPLVLKEAPLFFSHTSSPDHHKHMQELGQQSCIPHLPSPLDFGTEELERNEQVHKHQLNHICPSGL